MIVPLSSTAQDYCCAAASGPAHSSQGAPTLPTLPSSLIHPVRSGTIELSCQEWHLLPPGAYRPAWQDNEPSHLLLNSDHQKSL